MINGIKQFHNHREIFARTDFFLGAGGLCVGKKIVEIWLLAADGLWSLIGRVVGGDRFFDNVQLAHRNAHGFGQFQNAWLTRIGGFKFACFNFPTRDQLHHVGRNMNGLL